MTNRWGSKGGLHIAYAGCCTVEFACARLCVIKTMHLLILFYFNGKISLQKNKSSRRLWREKPSASNEEKEGAENVVSDIQRNNLITNSSSLKVEKIGNLTPVQDFEAMMQRRDSPEWVSKAIGDMKILILNLLENSSERSNCEMAIECLGALRRGCILEQVCHSV